jgi:hypothetical protein
MNARTPGPRDRRRRGEETGISLVLMVPVPESLVLSFLLGVSPFFPSYCK